MAREIVTLLGTELSLTCQGEGNPRPIVTWLKNGEVISNTADRVTVSTSETTDNIRSFLAIIKTRYQDHGEYACVFANYRGSANSSIVVTVEGLYLSTVCIHSNTLAKNLLYKFGLSFIHACNYLTLFKVRL